MIKRFCRIVIVVIFVVLFGYLVFVLKFVNLYERMIKFNLGNFFCYIILLYCYFDDKEELSVMVLYFGIFLFFIFINIIVIFGLYILVIRIIY